jgi:Probable Zinc-ribbon domain
VGTKKNLKPLSVTHPELAAEAVGWDPAKFSYGMNINVTWKCKNQHIYESIINGRALRGSGCPYCGGKKVLVGFNDLATTHPHLVVEVDGWDPKLFTFGSNKKMPWKCRNGHRWEVSINSRAGTKKSNCPYCSGLKTITGINDLSISHPKLAQQADGWDPSKFKAGSNKKMSWKCAKGHKWESAINKRAIEEQGCPTCSNHKTFKGFNDLRTTHPNLANEADGWDPTILVAGSGKKMSWKCAKGHRWDARVADRLSGNNCPYCSNTRVLSGFNDLKSLKPTLAKEANGWNPSNFLAGSTLKKSWKCKKGHTWNATIKARFNGSGCHICENQTIKVGFNDLRTTHPNLANEADGWDPTQVFANTRKLMNWICPSGHKFKSAGYSRVAGRGCPICSNKKLLKGFNDLATTHPLLAAEAVGWDPTLVTFGMGGKKLKWRCSKNHIYFSSLNNRRLSSDAVGGCPYCTGKQVLIGFNDFATTHPKLSKEADGWDTQTLTAGSNKKMKWTCAFGHKWNATVSSRVVGRGCPSCAITGFDPNKDGWLYFLSHPNWQMLQIGISNIPDVRIKKHKKLGWELLELRGPMDGYITQQWETAILRMLKAKGADLSNDSIAGKFDGYSESWSISTYEAKSLKQLMESTEIFEEQK